MKIEKYDVLFANFGAMYPTIEGIVISVDEDNKTATIVDEFNEEEVLSIDYVRNFSEYLANNGSPIGVFKMEC